MDAIDWHAHVFLRSLPMVPDRRYTPHTDAPLAVLRRLLIRNRMAGAVLVQPSFLGTANGFLLAALQELRGAASPQHFWGVVAVEADCALDRMRSLQSAGVIGCRLNLYARPLPDLRGRTWDRFFDSVNRLGWHVELHLEGPRLPLLLPQLIERCERLVIDHFGLPDPAQPQNCPGLKLLLEAPPERLWVKASAPYRVFQGLDADEASRRCAPLHRILVEALGPSHVLWGSDWPWTRFPEIAGYERTLAWGDAWRGTGPEGDA
ncbi:MAG: amidohydrolase family protein [Kiloniellales bacterium]|nr:amidohydrolase family protein [Kiloniellales bacterium]